ncbi:mechanosensitive ion channel domain-containing protein [Acidiphilium iwatense]|uniref:Mechanosensitive ion channel n=1 Tax=Acidiphilium iwatense TaxID=768198 RepID=A0ABS9DS57_9PROT|nr:mechanosensitive ion channel domain-containing protein [Acidiphilium iwatense]MCF3945570.1 mechanosensitive ion channel [Acidiphilium iwatense]
MRPIRRFLPFVAFAILVLGAASSGHAATNPLAGLIPGAATAQTAKQAAKPASPAPLDTAQIDAAVAALKNPQQRNALIATLEAMKTAAAHAKAAKPLGAGLGFVQATEEKIELVLTDLGGALRTATNISLVWHWLVFVATDAWLRQTVIRAAWRLAVVLATALAGEYLAIFLLRRPRAAILRRAALARTRPGISPDAAGIEAAEAGETEKLPRRRSIRRWFRRLPYAIGHFLLSLAPILVFALIGFLWVTGGFANERVAKLVILAVVNAYLVCRLVLEAARLLLAPGARQIRLIRTTDRRADWLVRWLRRLIGTIAFGYAAIATGGLFGLYHAASLVLVKLVSLAVHVMLAIMVLQARRPIAAMIRGDGHGSGFLAALRAGLARTWHIFALFYIVALWIAWAIGVPNAFLIMLRIMAVFIVVTAIARVLATWLGHGLETLFDESAAWRAHYPALYARGRMYMPVFKLIARAVLGVAASLVILQFWGLGVLAWLAGTHIGRSVVSAAITIGLAAFIALIVWEAASAGMEGHAERLIHQGRPGRATRYRTLLPMLRSTLLVIILVVAALVVLSAVGVNVTLLLGGLSIFGLAIGFGSQKLVQDIITGLFLLLEDAMQVGDWVTLGGIAGTVEKLSIRTIRLRGGDGSLNIIPFSSVTTVTNASRDFGYAPITIGVGYREDIDRVQAVIREIFDTMRAEPEWAAQISNDLELWGLDQFGASSVNIVGRIKTPAGKQYAVRREFNRRVKIRFDAENIEMPYNYQKITIDPAEFRAAFGRPKPADGGAQPGEANT